MPEAVKTVFKRNSKGLACIGAERKVDVVMGMTSRLKITVNAFVRI